MRRHARVAAVLIAVLPASVRGWEWTLRTGVLYDRSDLWSETAARATQPRLDLDLRLDLRGFVGGPGIAAFGGSAGYRWTSIELNGASAERSRTLTYNVDASLLRNRKSPVSMTLFASRVDGTFETSAGQVAGDRVTDTWGGAVQLTGAATPDLGVGFGRNTFDEQIGANPLHTRTTDTLTARVSHSVSAFGLGASFKGDWSDGTWVSDQYEDREVNVSGSVILSPDRDLTVVDRYYERDPTTAAAGAFGIRLNAFRATLRLGRAPGEATTLDYSDQRSVTESGGALSEAMRNSLRYGQDFRLSPTLFVRAVADVSATEQRAGPGDLRARGATVGPELWWRRRTTSDVKIAPGVRAGSLVEISGGPRVGVLDVRGEPTRFGFGGVFRARASGPWGPYDVTGSYDVAYGNDLFGLRGWTLDQAGSATLGGAGGPGRFNVQATLLARRAYAPVIGDEAVNSLTLLANYAWHRYTAFAQAAISSGILPGTDAFVGDGVFVPTGLSPRSTSASVGASVVLLSGLTARVSGGHLQSYLPGQPDISTLEAVAGLAYRYGAFEVAIDDRLTRTEDGVAPFVRNALFVRASRAFGSRY